MYDKTVHLRSYQAAFIVDLERLVNMDEYKRNFIENFELMEKVLIVKPIITVDHVSKEEAETLLADTERMLGIFCEFKYVRPYTLL